MKNNNADFTDYYVDHDDDSEFATMWLSLERDDVSQLGFAQCLLPHEVHQALMGHP
jgi:hypothetical protein